MIDFFRISKGAYSSKENGAEDSPHKTRQANGHASNGGDSGHMTWSGSDSAFRPIIHDGKQAVGGDAPMFKPRAIKNSFTDTSDSTDNDSKERRRRYRKKHELDKTKSSSMHDLLVETHDMQGKKQSLIKSHSQDALIDSASAAPVQYYSRLAPTIQPSHSTVHAPKPTVIYVKSSESENDSFESNTTHTTAVHRDGTMYVQQQQKQQQHQQQQHQQQQQRPQPPYEAPPKYQKAPNNYYIYRYDSDSSSCSEQRNRPGQQPFPRRHVLQKAVHRQASREESVSSHGSNHSGHAHLTASRSDDYLNTVGSTTTDSYESDAPKERGYSRPNETSAEKMFRGSVVYYSAEIDGRLRTEVRDYAKQVVSK